MIGCFTDHNAPVLTVQFDPIGEFLVSTFTNMSSVKYWLALYVN